MIYNAGMNLEASATNKPINRMSLSSRYNASVSYYIKQVVSEVMLSIRCFSHVVSIMLWGSNSHPTRELPGSRTRGTPCSVQITTPQRDTAAVL